jgi:hypothetical protein
MDLLPGSSNKASHQGAFKIGVHSISVERGREHPQMRPGWYLGVSLLDSPKHTLEICTPLTVMAVCWQTLGMVTIANSCRSQGAATVR